MKLTRKTRTNRTNSASRIINCGRIIDHHDYVTVFILLALLSNHHLAVLCRQQKGRGIQLDLGENDDIIPKLSSSSYLRTENISLLQLTKTQALQSQQHDLKSSGERESNKIITQTEETTTTTPRCQDDLGKHNDELVQPGE